LPDWRYPTSSENYQEKFMTQYSKRMILIHWLTLALLVVAWFLGDALADATDESRATLAGYIVHGLVGGTIILLTVARLFFRSQDGTPPAIGQTTMDKVAKGVHHSLYTVLFLLPVSGIVTVMTSDAGRALLSGDAGLLPKKDDYENVFAHGVHGVLVTALILLVVVHVLGAIKHQFITKDGLMERMLPRRK
jgi:cytochrome b561